MAYKNGSNRSGNQGGYVDISSNSQVKKVYKKRGRGKRIFIIFFSVVFLICGSGLLYYYSVLESLNYNFSGNIGGNDNNTSGDGNDSIGSQDSNLTFDGKTLLSDPKVLNVMLFGEDYSDGEDHGRSDSMIMMTIDNRHQKLKLTTFMRDTYVYIPGYDYQKINAAYMFGGPALAIKTIQANFGIKIDRYAVVNYESFVDIVDIMGGVDIELTEDEIGYINFQMYINDQVDGPTTITDSPGVVHLNGTEALWYARDRGFYEPDEYPGVVFEGDDWDRTRRQRNFLSTVFASMKNASLPQIVSIVGKVGPLVTTNFKKDEITTLVANSLKYLKYDVEEFSVPHGNQGAEWDYVNDPVKGSYIQINDLDLERKEIASFVFEELVSGASVSSSSASR